MDLPLKTNQETTIQNVMARVRLQMRAVIAKNHVFCDHVTNRFLRLGAGFNLYSPWWIIRAQPVRVQKGMSSTH